MAPPMKPAISSPGPRGATSRSTTVPWIFVMKSEELELRNALLAMPRKMRPGTMKGR